MRGVSPDPTDGPGRDPTRDEVGVRGRHEGDLRPRVHEDRRSRKSCVGRLGRIAEREGAFREARVVNQVPPSVLRMADPKGNLTVTHQEVRRRTASDKENTQLAQTAHREY